MNTSFQWLTQRAVGLLLISVIFAPVRAEDAPPTPPPGMGMMNPPAFTDFDTDKDGYISEAELNAGRAQRMAAQAADGRRLKNVANATPFADIDTSKDGKIDPTEFAAHQAQHRKPAQP